MAPVGQIRYADTNELLSRKLAEKRALIAVHRGSWGGNIIQNTCEAYSAALQMGADMVESDVVSSTDGVLYSFHDGHEQDVFGVSKSIKEMSSEEIEGYHPRNSVTLPCARRISRLSEVLDFLSGKDALLNIDRAWDIFPQVLAMLDTCPQAKHQVVLKAPLRAWHAFEALAAHPVKYMFMPICYSMADVEAALSLPGLNVVGIEAIAAHKDSELFTDEAIAAIHARDLFVWVNAITLTDFRPESALFGGLDDDISVIEDPEKGWGELLRKHIDIIQTDWPALLHAFRARKLGV